jgi:hypothetical protein
MTPVSHPLNIPLNIRPYTSYKGSSGYPLALTLGDALDREASVT